LRDPISDISRFQPADQRLLGTPAALLQRFGANLQLTSDLLERHAAEARLADHKGVVGPDDAVADGLGEHEVGMAEGPRWDLGQADRRPPVPHGELPADDPVGTVEAGGDELPGELRRVRLEAFGSFEQPGERLGLDVGGALGKGLGEWVGDLAESRKQHPGESNRGGAVLGLGAGEKQPDRSVAGAVRRRRLQQQVA